MLASCVAAGAACTPNRPWREGQRHEDALRAFSAVLEAELEPCGRMATRKGELAELQLAFGGHRSPLEGMSMRGRVSEGTAECVRRAIAHADALMHRRREERQRAVAVVRHRIGSIQPLPRSGEFLSAWARGDVSEVALVLPRYAQLQMDGCISLPAVIGVVESAREWLEGIGAPIFEPWHDVLAEVLLARIPSEAFRWVESERAIVWLNRMYGAIDVHFVCARRLDVEQEGRVRRVLGREGNCVAEELGAALVETPVAAPKGTGYVSVESQRGIVCGATRRRVDCCGLPGGIAISEMPPGLGEFVDVRIGRYGDVCGLTSRGAAVCTRPGLREPVIHAGPYATLTAFGEWMCAGGPAVGLDCWNKEGARHSTAAPVQTVEEISGDFLHGGALCVRGEEGSVSCRVRGTGPPIWGDGAPWTSADGFRAIDAHMYGFCGTAGSSFRCVTIDTVHSAEGFRTIAAIDLPNDIEEEGQMVMVPEPIDAATLAEIRKRHGYAIDVGNPRRPCILSAPRTGERPGIWCRAPGKWVEVRIGSEPPIVRLGGGSQLCGIDTSGTIRCRVDPLTTHPSRNSLSD